LRREEEHARRILGPVLERVRAIRPLGEADDVTRTKLALTLGRPHGRRPGDDERPLLVAVMEVVRERALPGRELVQARSNVLGANPRADSRRPPAKAVAILLAVPLFAVEVERVANS
jgi:hypothetical protein